MNPSTHSGSKTALLPYRRFDDESITLGLTLTGHDISYVVLGSDGAPLFIAEEERYSRRKRGSFAASPRQIYQILEEVGVERDTVRHLAIANVQEMVEHRPRQAHPSTVTFGLARFSSALVRAITVKFPELESINYVRHHLCHGASAFFPSPYESAAIVTVDGMGEDETATIWHGQGNLLTRRYSIRHPHSLGYLYGAIASWAGMSGAEKEGKLMGLASLGEPRYLSELREHFLTSLPEGGFRVSPALTSIPCESASWVAYCEKHLGSRRNSNMELTQYHADVAASIQQLLEETLKDFLNLAYHLTGEQYCCLAGGVFMNSMANGRLRREGPFKDLWVQPLAQDNGLSLGAALWSYTRRHPDHPRWRMTSPFWGSDVGEKEIQDLLVRYAIKARRSDYVEQETAQYLANGKLVGWVQGRSEVGARSLGHRSILADPRDPNTKQRLNSHIKLREEWRPFAPIVLEEDVVKYFTDARLSPFMTFVSPALPESPIPAALHVDCTARLQTVNASFDERLYRLLQSFKSLTGIGVLVNTSFNVRGEPIVRTIEDAYRDFVGSGMDTLVIGDYIIEKPNDFVWSGFPVNAPSPHIQVASELTSLVSEGHQIAIVSLGSSNFLNEVQNSIADQITNAKRVDLFLAPPTGTLNYPISLKEVFTLDKRSVLIADLSFYELLLLLLPTWCEVALDLIPNLLDPFVGLLRHNNSTRIYILDEAGGIESLSNILDEWAKSGPRGAASEVEHFWLYRRM